MEETKLRKGPKVLVKRSTYLWLVGDYTSS